MSNTETLTVFTSSASSSSSNASFDLANIDLDHFTDPDSVEALPSMEDNHPSATVPAVEETSSPDDLHIARPPNCFILFRQYYNTTRNGEKHQTSVSVAAGNTWRGMTAEDKQVWRAESRRLAQRHREMFPHYKYAPRRKNGKGRIKAQKSKSQKGAPGPQSFSDTIPPSSQILPFEDPRTFTYGHSLPDFGQFSALPTPSPSPENKTHTTPTDFALNMASLQPPTFNYNAFVRMLLGPNSVQNLQEVSAWCNEAWAVLSENSLSYQPEASALSLPMASTSAGVLPSSAAFAGSMVPPPESTWNYGSIFPQPMPYEQRGVFDDIDLC